MLLADLDAQEAPALDRAVAARIQLLLSTPISIGPVELRADASIGLALYPLDASDEDGLLGAADLDMYGRMSGHARRLSSYVRRPSTTPKTVCRQVAWAKARGFVRSGGTPGVPRAG